MKFWYWSQPAVALALLPFIVYTLVNFLGETGGDALFSIQFAVNGLFVLPGVVLSLGLNQWLLSRRTPRAVTMPERVLLGGEYVILAVLIATSFGLDALVVGLVLWPLLIVLAIVIAIVIPVMTSRLARPVVDSPWAASPSDQTPEGGIDDLLGR